MVNQNLKCLAFLLVRSRWEWVVDAVGRSDLGDNGIIISLGDSWGILNLHSLPFWFYSSLGDGYSILNLLSFVLFSVALIILGDIFGARSTLSRLPSDVWICSILDDSFGARSTLSRLPLPSDVWICNILGDIFGVRSVLSRLPSDVWIWSILGDIFGERSNRSRLPSDVCIYLGDILGARSTLSPILLINRGNFLSKEGGALSVNGAGGDLS